MWIVGEEEEDMLKKGVDDAITANKGEWKKMMMTLENTHQQIVFP